MIRLKRDWSHNALVVAVLVVSISSVLGAITPEELLEQQIANRDSVASLRAEVRWVETREDKEFKTEQVIKHDDLSRLYLTELCPDPSINESDFGLDALLREPGYGFYYGHIYDGHSTLLLSFQAEGRDVAIIDGPVESPLLLKARTPQSITTALAISALSQTDATPLIETNGDLTEVVIQTATSKMNLTFDASKGFMPTRIDRVQNGVRVHVTADYRKFGSVWFPIVGERVIYKSGGPHSASFTVESILINEPLNDEEFQFRLRDGVEVNDSRFGCTWTYATNRPEIGAPKPSTSLSSTRAPTHWGSVVRWLTGGVVFAASILFVREKSRPLTRKVDG